MKAIVLAAGYATRLYPLTKDRPKPLLRIGEKTILDYMLDGFSQLNGLDTVYVVTNQKFAQTFQEWADIVNSSHRYKKFTIVVVNDGTTSNETRLGAIADIQYVIDQHHLNDDLLVAAGDNIFQFDFKELQAQFVNKENDVIVAQQLDDPIRLRQRGVVGFDTDNKVTSFQEKPDDPKSNFVCPALYLHKKENIGKYKEYLSGESNPDAPGHFIKWLHTQVPVYVYVMQKPAIDIGTLEVYEKVNKEFLGQESS